MEYLQGGTAFDAAELQKAYRASVSTFWKTALVPAATVIAAELYRRSGFVFDPKEKNTFLDLFFKIVDNELYKYALITCLSGLIFIMVWQSKEKLFAGEYRSLAGIEKISSLKYLAGYPEPVQALIITHKFGAIFSVIMSVVGFIVFARSGSPADFYMCLIVTAGLLWYSYPRYEAWEGFAKRLARGGGRFVSGVAAGVSYPLKGTSGAGTDDDYVVRADRQYRKNFVLLLVLFLALGASLIYGLITYMEYLDILHKTAPGEAVHKFVLAVWVMLSAIILASAGTGAYFILVAVRVMKSDRFPPPGMKVLTDTKVIMGVEARAKAVSITMLAIVLVGFAAALFVVTPKALDKAVAKTHVERQVQPLPKGATDGNDRG